MVASRMEQKCFFIAVFFGHYIGEVQVASNVLDGDEAGGLSLVDGIFPHLEVA